MPPETLDLARLQFAITAGGHFLFVALTLGLATLVGTTADTTTLAYLVPALLGVTPFLVLTQAWVWWLFRHRVTRPAYL